MKISKPSQMESSSLSYLFNKGSLDPQNWMMFFIFAKHGLRIEISRIIFSSFPFISEVGIYREHSYWLSGIFEERKDATKQGRYSAMKQVDTEYVSWQRDRDQVRPGIVQLSTVRVCGQPRNRSPHLRASTHHPVGGRHLAKLLKKGKVGWRGLVEMERQLERGVGKDHVGEVGWMGCRPQLGSSSVLNVWNR